MDSMISAAARALAAGDPLGALQRVALRDDAPALALRGIAMAQLGEHPRARELLRAAGRGFGARASVSRARCIVAEAEVALAMRDLRGSTRSLAAATAVLERRSDRVNAQQARMVAARRALLLGRLDDAAVALARIDLGSAPAALVAVAELTSAELALRTLHVGAARDALDRAGRAAERSGIPALVAEVADARAVLDRPAARRIDAGGERALRLAEVEMLVRSGALIVDACRRGLRVGDAWRSLARRPVLLELARALAAASPDDVDRNVLIARVFRTRRPDDSHRARLRVEIGRLRGLARGLALIDATPRGFVLQPQDGRPVVLLEPPIDGEQASLLALLADGAAWSTSSLALALGASQRTVQRALVELESGGRVRAIRRARARRWLASPLTGFATTLLLPAALALE